MEDYTIVLDDYDAYKAVANLLRELKFNLIADYVEKHRENDAFFTSCINLILHRAPDNLQYHVREVLYMCNLIDEKDMVA